MTNENDDYIYRCPKCGSTKVIVYHSTSTGFSHNNGKTVSEKVVDVDACYQIDCKSCGHRATNKAEYETFHDYENDSTSVMITQLAKHATRSWIGVYQVPSGPPVIEEFESGLNEDPFPAMLELLKEKDHILNEEDFMFIPHDGDTSKVLYYRRKSSTHSITLIRGACHL